MALIIILVLIGLFFLLLEILVIPGTTITGVLGSISIGIAIWQSYALYGEKTGTIILFGILLLAIVFIYFALKSNTWQRIMLKKNIDGKVSYFDSYQPQEGDEGITISRLAPMGKARFNEDYFEVKSSKGLIDPNTKIIITRIENNQIIVQPKNN